MTGTLCELDGSAVEVDSLIASVESIARDIGLADLQASTTEEERRRRELVHGRSHEQLSCTEVTGRQCDCSSRLSSGSVAA